MVNPLTLDWRRDSADEPKRMAGNVYVLYKPAYEVSFALTPEQVDEAIELLEELRAFLK